MQTTEYPVDDKTKYVVHHFGDCTGTAIFTIIDNWDAPEEKWNRIEACETIENVQAAVAYRSWLEQDAIIKIDGVSFKFEGILSIMRELAHERLFIALEKHGKNLTLANILTVALAVERLSDIHVSQNED